MSLWLFPLYMFANSLTIPTFLSVIPDIVNRESSPVGRVSVA